MNMLRELFADSAAITPTAAEDQRADFANIPAKAAVYLLTTGTDDTQQPLLLATVGDLRAALRRRLADTPPDAKSKRIAYGQLCSRVHYRIVHSAFAANFYYAAAARALFPQTAAALIPWNTSWWIAVERDAPNATPFPRFRKTNNLSDPALAYAGPIRDKHAAQRLVESLEDLFDLCRYHNILVQAPHGKPCSYKEMGKCPAPCDGSVSLSSYRNQINAALAFAIGTSRDTWREQLEAEMRSAAAALQFETAGRLKQRLSRAGLLATEPYAATAALEAFTFLTLQPGKGKPWIEPWLIHFTGKAAIQPLAPFHIKQLAASAESLAGKCLRLASAPAPAALTPAQAADAALVAHHLFRGDADHGIWLRLSQVSAQGAPAIITAAEALRARKSPKPLLEHSTDTSPTEPVADEA